MMVKALKREAQGRNIRHALYPALLGLTVLFAGIPGETRAAEAVTEAVTENLSGAQTLQSGRTASAADMADVENVLEDWMTPIDGSALLDGIYDVKVNCSSSMFKIEKASLIVQDGRMSAVLTMGGDGYLFVYPGTAKEAAAAPDEDLIAYTEDPEGRPVFLLPIAGLDQEVPCAAYSRRKEQWYDRSLAFVSSSLDPAAFRDLPVTTVEDLSLTDGEYLVDAFLSGGSGRASIESPARLTVEDGQAYLTVVFSSRNYDYMLVDGTRYEPAGNEGNSTFVIPVPGFDYQMPVTADTVAMSRPHEIDYTILLPSDSLRQ